MSSVDEATRIFRDLGTLENFRILYLTILGSSGMVTGCFLFLIEKK
jgi:hypothetical protein